jgi:hypothetical protein
MYICKNCRVELEPDMDFCPLCEQPVNSEVIENQSVDEGNQERSKSIKSFESRRMSKPQRRATWELVSIIIILLVITTSLINYVIHRSITWSEYPVAVFLVVFAYVSSFAFLNQGRGIQLLLAFVTASIGILVLDVFTGGPNWALELGIPLLFFANLVVMLLGVVFRSAKQRGINLIAYAFLAAILLCLFVEATIDFYMFNEINLVWSLIVSACFLPVVAVILFMHHRMKKGRDLNRTFHI